MAEYWAHIAKDGRTQTILEHLEGAARRCAASAAVFGAEEQGREAGLAHDLGKYSGAFQRRLRGGPKVDHATAGAFECMKLGQPFAAFAVAGHHGKGLPDGGGRGDGPETGTFWGRMNRAEQGRLDDYSAWTRELSLPAAAVPDFLRKDKLAGMFFTRMLFSCLVDADYADTGEFMDGQAPDVNEPAPIERLWERLQAHISGWFPPEGELNARRCAILERCIREGERRAPRSVHPDGAYRRRQDGGLPGLRPWPRPESRV